MFIRLSVGDNDYTSHELAKFVEKHGWEFQMFRFSDTVEKSAEEMTDKDKLDLAEEIRRLKKFDKLGYEANNGGGKDVIKEWNKVLSSNIRILFEKFLDGNDSKEFLLGRFKVKAIKRIDYKWENGETIYYIPSNNVWFSQ